MGQSDPVGTIWGPGCSDPVETAWEPGCSASVGTAWDLCGAEECVPVIGFVDYFAPENWTTEKTFARDPPADVAWSAPDSVLITGSSTLDSSDPLDGVEGDVWVEIVIPSDGVAGFSWEWSSQEYGSHWDPTGYFLNGQFTELTSGCNSWETGDTCEAVETGTESVDVLEGDVFGLVQRTIDNAGELAETTFSSFSFSPCGP